MEKQDTAVHKNSLKFSVVKPNLVIYKKEGNRKKGKDACCTCMSEPHGYVARGLLKHIVLRTEAEAHSWKRPSLIYSVPAPRTVTCISIGEATTFIWKTYHSPHFLSFALRSQHCCDRENGLLHG